MYGNNLIWMMVMEALALLSQLRTSATKDDLGKENENY